MGFDLSQPHVFLPPQEGVQRHRVLEPSPVMKCFQETCFLGLGVLVQEICCFHVKKSCKRTGKVTASFLETLYLQMRVSFWGTVSLEMRISLQIRAPPLETLYLQMHVSPLETVFPQMRISLLGAVSPQTLVSLPVTASDEMRVSLPEAVCLTKSLGLPLTTEAKRQSSWKKLGVEILGLQGSKKMARALIPNYFEESCCRSTILYGTADVNNCSKLESYVRENLRLRRIELRSIPL